MAGPQKKLFAEKTVLWRQQETSQNRTTAIYCDHKRIRRSSVDRIVAAGESKEGRLYE